MLSLPNVQRGRKNDISPQLKLFPVTSVRCSTLATFGCSTGANGDIAAKQLNKYYYEKCYYCIR